MNLGLAFHAGSGIVRSINELGFYLAVHFVVVGIMHLDIGVAIKQRFTSAKCVCCAVVGF